MRHDPILKCGVAALLLVAGTHIAGAEKPGAQEYNAQLSGFAEIGALNNNSGAILTNGSGQLTLTIEQGVAQYSLIFSGLTSNITQAHLHFGQKHVAGGIFVWLCTNLGNGPPGTQACPPIAKSGTVSGIIGPSNIVAVTGQNIVAGDFNALLAALAFDTAYVNVHTVNFAAGEIRGQVELREKDKDQGKGEDQGKGKEQGKGRGQ